MKPNNSVLHANANDCIQSFNKVEKRVTNKCQKHLSVCKTLWFFSQIRTKISFKVLPSKN